MRKSRPIILVLIMILVLLAAAAVLPLKTGAFGWRDFLSYWAASHLMVTGGNPYDLSAVDHVVQEVSPERGGTEPAWNPPWLVVALVPLGILPYEFAARVWLLINLLLLSCLPLLIWQWLAGSSGPRPPIWLPVIGLAFAASLIQIAIGQITVVILLGFVLCLAGLRSGHDGWAGAALVLSFSKPHLAYLALPMILIWAAMHRRWQVWLGLAAAALAGLIVATVLSPAWASSYRPALGSNDFWIKLTATVGGVGRAMWGTDVFRYLGVLTWLLIPWLVRLADQQGLLTSVNVALLISLPLAPYGWSFDQIMLLPAITQIVFWLMQTTDRDRQRIGAFSLAAIYAIMFGMKLMGLGDFFFAGVPLALGVLYAALYLSQRGIAYA